MQQEVSSDFLTDITQKSYAVNDKTQIQTIQEPIIKSSVMNTAKRSGPREPFTIVLLKFQDRILKLSNQENAEEIKLIKQDLKKLRQNYDAFAELKEQLQQKILKLEAENAHLRAESNRQETQIMQLETELHQAQDFTLPTNSDDITGKLNQILSITNATNHLLKANYQDTIRTTTGQPKPSYAQVAKKNQAKNTGVNSTVKTKNVIIISGKDQMMATNMREQVKKLLHSQLKKVHIDKMVNLNNGKILVQWEQKKDCEIIKQHIQSIGQDKYQVTEDKKRYPTVLLVGMDKDINDEDIINGITQRHNHTIINCAQDLEKIKTSIKIILKKNKGERTIAVVRIHPTL